MGFNMTLHKADFCVVGGGLAGMCAAIEAAREGRKTVLMHERPVFGGNASSEIRMWICGCGGSGNRETGILEELQLEALYRNPYKLYAVWDGVLFDAVKREPNLTALLNCSCCEAETDGNVIKSVTGWQMTTQTWQKVEAKQFADCSGDSVLAPLTGASFRVGRESKYEFGEDIPEEESDLKTMGMSCLIQARKLDHPVTYIAPPFAKKLTEEEMNHRVPNLENSGENFWYLELGGDRNSIDDTETVRDELIALAYGVWDYVKNSGKLDASLWQLDFIGFLPGKRESRRMTGEYIMTQPDVSSGGRFDDIVAFGGWPLDDHDPAGFWHRGRPCVQLSTPTPYGIPLRVLYSENIKNLWFAGRNISMTHAAMSSSRVMATCALLGQAVGAGASCALSYSCDPHEVYALHIAELKQTLMDADCFLPYNRRRLTALTMNAKMIGDAENPENLRNGADRCNHTYGEGEMGSYIKLGGCCGYEFAEPETVTEARAVFDSDLDRVTLPGDGCERIHSTRSNVKSDSPVMCMPKTLVREYAVEISEDGESFRELFRETNNLRRMVKIPVGARCAAVRLRIVSLWDDGERDKAHIYSFDVK